MCLYIHTKNSTACVHLFTRVDSMGQSNGVEVTFSERSFTGLESTEQLMVTILILGDAEEPFDLNVIPIAKYPMDAEGMIIRKMLSIYIHSL